MYLIFILHIFSIHFILTFKLLLLGLLLLFFLRKKQMQRLDSPTFESSINCMHHLNFYYFHNLISFSATGKGKARFGISSFGSGYSSRNVRENESAADSNL